MLTMRPSLANQLLLQPDITAQTKRARTKVRAKSGLFAMKYAATGCLAMPEAMLRHRKL
ncbi:hypothetical protein [Rhizobium sp. SG570]|uniref:hypothetical protein n=1 Tax=Rhizobium sp. SG570 TaxID=2587113 RepID=UPI0014450836|nr:hypothetical protein [Rhizobium sp. SG570]NKJ36065.1 hypothetical protein [Rhizobium sp. SG570]